MKDKTQFEKDEALSKLLRTWKLEAELPPRFQESVWKRIECAERDVRIPFWRVFLAQAQAAFRRPALAVVYIALLTGAGLGAGYWHAEDRAAAVNSEMRTRYVQSVDPYQMPR